jgi:broad specificity phosphatase PhoE
VAIHLIRHAHAGNRSSWRGDDIDRPLSDRGRVQAAALVPLLEGGAIEQIHSSASRRCIETVEPLAEHLQLKVRPATELFEGAEPEPALAFMLRHAAKNPAMCSHGDLIPKIIRRLIAAGMHTKDPNIAQKGSVWILETDGDRIVGGRYLPPAKTATH